MLIAALAIIVALSGGCLFPPVDPDPDDPNPRDRTDPAAPTTGAGPLVSRSGQQVRDGTVGPGVRAGGDGVGAEALDVVFALPPRVTAFTVTLDWFDDDATGTNQTARLHDLELSVVVELLSESGNERVWGPATDDGGGPGNPDAPVTIASDPREPGFTVANQTMLTATITPESSAGGVRWVCTLDYQHLSA